MVQRKRRDQTKLRTCRPFFGLAESIEYLIHTTSSNNALSDAAYYFKPCDGAIDLRYFLQSAHSSWRERMDRVTCVVEASAESRPLVHSFSGLESVVLG